MNTKQITQFLEKNGFQFHRQGNGCHKIYRHENGSTIVWSHSTGRRSSPAALRNLKAQVKRLSASGSNQEQFCA